MNALLSFRTVQKTLNILGILVMLVGQLSLGVRSAQAGPALSIMENGRARMVGNLSTGNLSNNIMNGCGPAAGNAAIPFPAGGKSATVAFSQEPDLVDALFSSMSYSAWVDQMVQVGLGTWDANNNLVPELATDIPTAANGGVSADGLTITWHLKPCLFWSDGQPLTSADVKFTWQLLNDPVNSVYTRAGYDQISSIDTPDDTTVILHFTTLYPAW